MVWRKTGEIFPALIPYNYRVFTSAVRELRVPPSEGTRLLNPGQGERSVSVHERRGGESGWGEQQVWGGLV